MTSPTQLIIDDLVYSIISTCEALHGEVTGTSASVHTYEDLTRLAKWLRMRLDNWKPGILPQYALYEHAVFVLASAALAEWDRYFGKG
jgi:hypothetical protein